MRISAKYSCYRFRVIDAEIVWLVGVFDVMYISDEFLVHAFRNGVAVLRTCALRKAASRHHQASVFLECMSAILPISGAHCMWLVSEHARGAR